MGMLAQNNNNNKPNNKSGRMTLRAVEKKKEKGEKKEEKGEKKWALPGTRRVGGPGEKGTRVSAVTCHARAAQVAGAAGVVRTAVFNLSKNPIMGKS